MRLIVCGGRTFRDRQAVFAALDRLHAKRGISFLIQGAADGADYLAWQWAEARGVPCGSYAANWQGEGRAAGTLRNQRMIDEGAADGVVAFPGGRGTADLIARAKRAGLKVWEPGKGASC
jgi:hypothetical protein